MSPLRRFLTRQLGGSCGIAVLGSYLTRHIASFVCVAPAVLFLRKPRAAQAAPADAH